jgi:phosphoribosyl 1,2-cyclic phosphate phosphodiesterase
VRVRFLGTGTSHGVPAIGCRCDVCRSPDPHDRRLRASIYVQWDDGCAVLVDTSTDLRAQALAYDLRRIDAICFTHSHADHIMGLDDVRAFNTLQGGPIQMYADASTAADLRQTFGYAFRRPSVAAGGVPDLRLDTIDGPFAVCGHEIVPVPVYHGPRLILGFRFDAFAYLTDCNRIPASSLPLLSGLDTLVLDALRPAPHPTHFTLAEAVDAARGIGARATYFTHIAHDLGHAATVKTLPPGMTLAHDGLELVFDETAAVGTSGRPPAIF